MQEQKQPENKKAVAWLTAGHTLADSYGSFMNPILPFIAAKIGISLAIATLAFSISHLFSSLLQPIFGFFADKWQKRFFIFWGILMASALIPLTGLAQNFWQLALCLIIGGMGISFFHPQATSFIHRYSGNNIAKNMSLFIAAGAIGNSLGPIISSSITQFFGLNKLPIASIWGVLFAFCVFLFVPKIKAANFVKNKDSFKTTLTEILKNRTMNVLIMISVLKSLVVASFSLLLPFYWKDLGFNAFQIGIAVFLFLTFGALATFLSSKLERKIGYKKVFYISLIVPFVLTLIFVSIVKSVPVLSFIFFIATGFVSMLSVSINMVLAQKTMPQYKSMISGFIGGFGWGIVGVSLPLIGFIAEHIGIVQSLVIISFIPFALSYLVKFLPNED